MEIKNWLDGEWALILGSSSGFGAEVSVKLSEYGVNIITIKDTPELDYKVDFVDLKLPKLIRKTIKVNGKMIEDDINHVLYEVTGSIDELSKVENSSLLDKKIATQPVEDSKLDLKNKSIVEEL